MKNKRSPSPFTTLTPFEPKTGELNVIIETPQGSQNKYKFDEKVEMFRLAMVLPLGESFPFDFGYIPGTVGQDGDPLDVLVLMDQAGFTGCLVRARLLGLVEGKQTENGHTIKNDRLIAVAACSRLHQDVRAVEDLHGNLMKEIEYFLECYPMPEGKRFKAGACRGPKQAERAVKKGAKRYLAR